MPEDSIGKITVYKLKIGSIRNIRLRRYTLVKNDVFSEDGRDYEYRLYFLNQFPANASWYGLFQHLGLEIEEDTIPKVISNGFILFIKINNSFFGVTGGVGHHHLKKVFSIEPRFGITMAQKLLSMQELKGLIQLDTSGVNYRLDRVFRGVYNPSGDIDNLKRILKIVRGTFSKDNPFYDVIGRSLHAGEALTVNGQKSFAEIMRFLVHVDDLWNSDDYKISIPQLDAINPKYNPDLIIELKQALVSYLSVYNENDCINLFLDNEEIGYLPDRVQQYQLIYNRHRYDPVVSFEEIFSQVRNILVEINDRDNQYQAFDKISLDITFDDEKTERMPINKYVCGDIIHNNEVYFINNNLWYRASEEFISKLDNELDNIEFIHPETLNLIEWNVNIHSGGEAETLYNQDNRSFLMLHKRLVSVTGGRGGIEFCDLLKQDNGAFQVVHVKHACGAALRELFAQGLVSSKLFSDSEEFRTKVINNQLSIPDEQATTTLSALDGKHKREITVIYAIFDEKQSHVVRTDSQQTSDILRGTLTPFAKVDLLDRIHSIRSMGYNVAVTRIKPYS